MVADDPRNAARLFRPVLTQQHAHFCGRQLPWGGPDKEQRTHDPLLPSISTPRAPPWSTAISFGTAIWWDIFDVQHWALSSCWQWLQYFLIGCAQCGASLSLPFFLIVAIVELIVLGAQMVWSRPFATQQGGKCSSFRTKWVYFVCPLAMCACTAHAVTPERPHGQVWWTARLPPPTDLELWCSGQLTVSEQLALALQRAIGERPLESQALWPDNIGREGPQPVPPPPPQREIAQEEPDPWLIDEDEEDTTHISFRLFSPHFESESIDISLTFPLVAEDVLDFLKDTARVITAPWLTTAAFTQPQLHNDYGSVVIFPSWLRVSPQTVLVLDASEIGQGQFAFYHKGDLTRAQVLQQLEAIPEFAIEIFAFGRRTPMTETEALEPVLAGLIKVVRTGAPVQWASSIEPRLALRANWDPDTPHPDHVGGSHIAFQTSTDQKLHRVFHDDLFTPLGVASEIFDREQQQIWVRAPTIRPVGLYWKGRRVHSVIAVVDAFEHPPIDSYIVTLDLRGVGLWPIWVALQQNCFFPGDVVEALDIHFCQGFSLVVTGGRKGRTPGLLYIQDGDLLEASLRATADITPTQHEGGESEDDDEESDNGDTDSTRDMLPSSDELPDAPFPTGPGPFGPPPPQPVNRDRSRSPARGHPASRVQPEIISLIDHFPKRDVERYSLSANAITLPQADFNPMVIYRPWPPTWLRFETSCLNVPLCTQAALQTFWPWTAVLSLCASHGPPHLRLYTDGSWLEKAGLGGFSVVVVLEVQSKCALFGAVCAQTHGNAVSPWPQAGPQALRNEQFALASAMLWVFQSLPWIVFASITFCYDCLAAGMAACGEWAPDCEMMQRIRHLQLWLIQVAGAPVAFEHVKAHSNHPMNELADCIAKGQQAVTSQD
ncbi:Pol [Symbiodinium sp. CCMP2592]|nr:Pol [Symbiodinium sp. CCMP2592]